MPDIPRVPRKHKDDPKMIGPWKIGRTIGKGASGHVRIARHSQTGQHSAIKIIPKSALPTSNVSLDNLADEMDAALLAVEREIVILKLIDHPNIMRLYDVWETSTQLYLILEYADGGELFEYLCSNGRLAISEALGYFQQMISAVDYCHRFNIAHRDLKPENVLLDKNNNIKIADFGMAGWQADGLLQTACGSPHYAAPEVVCGRAYNGSSADIWSCGVILHALLTGKLPFDDEDITSLLEKVKRGVFIMPQDIPADAQDLLSCILTVDVKKRISIPEIMQHPFFVSQPPKSPTRPMPTLDVRPVLDIDANIFANLVTLWHETPEDKILESLTNDEETWQKGVYHLLVDYRTRQLENYDEDEEERVAQLIARKRNKKKELKRQKTLPQLSSGESWFKPSISSLPPRDGPPTPNRARRGNYPSDTPIITLHSPSIEQKYGDPHCTPVVPDIQDERLQQFLYQIVDRLQEINERTLAAGGTPDPGASPTIAVLIEALGQQPIAVRDTGIESIHAEVLQAIEEVGGEYEVLSKNVETFGLGINAGNSGTQPLRVGRRGRPMLDMSVLSGGDKENGPTSTVGKKSSLKNKFKNDIVNGKKVQILEPPRLLRKPNSPALTDASASTLGSPVTPASPAAPRRNWFNSVFSFKPASYHLLSTSDTVTAHSTCRRLLMSLGVLVQLDGGGVLKCRLDELKDPLGVMGVLKAVKFRVETHPAAEGPSGAGYQVALHLIQEKGASSSFGAVFERLRREWDLDAPTPVVGYSPAFEPVQFERFEVYV